MKRKSHMEWSWIIMLSFIVLSILDIRFGLFGFACMTIPLIHAFKGHGKVHCSHYCPRGSLLGRFLQKFHLGLTPPDWLRTKTTKNVLLATMAIMLTLSINHAQGNLHHIAFAVFRLMMVSLVVGVLMGILFKPRTWCQVCPMGHATHLVQMNLVPKPSVRVPAFESSAPLKTRQEVAHHIEKIKESSAA